MNVRPSPIFLGFWPPAAQLCGAWTVWGRTSALRPGNPNPQAQGNARTAGGERAETWGSDAASWKWAAPCAPRPHQLGQAPPGEDAAGAAEVQVAGAPAAHVEPVHGAGRRRPVLPVQQDQLLLSAHSGALQHPLQLRENRASGGPAEPWDLGRTELNPAWGRLQRPHTGCRLAGSPTKPWQVVPGSAARPWCAQLFPWAEVAQGCWLCAPLTQPHGHLCTRLWPTLSRMQHRPCRTRPPQGRGVSSCPRTRGRTRVMRAEGGGGGNTAPLRPGTSETHGTDSAGGTGLRPRP